MTPVPTISRHSSISVWSRSAPAPYSVVGEGSSSDSRDDVPSCRMLVRGRRRRRYDLERPCPGAWEIAIQHCPCEDCRFHYRTVSDLNALVALGLEVDRNR